MLSQKTITRVDKLVSMLMTVGLKGIKVCGSLRRGIDSTHDIDIMAQGELSRVLELPVYVVDIGKKKIKIHYQGMDVDIYRYEPAYFGAMQMFLTGPAGYNIGYRVKAKKMGMTLNQYGLWAGDIRVAGKTEEEVYNALGKEWKPPEERG